MATQSTPRTTTTASSLKMGIFAYPPSCGARHEGAHAESQVMPSPGGERIGGAVFMRYSSA